MVAGVVLVVRVVALLVRIAALIAVVAALLSTSSGAPSASSSGGVRVVALLVRVVAAVVESAFWLWRCATFCVFRGAGLRVSRVRFSWQAQYLVTPGVGVGESVWSGV